MKMKCISFKDYEQKKLNYRQKIYRKIIKSIKAF